MAVDSITRPPPGCAGESEACISQGYPVSARRAAHTAAEAVHPLQMRRARLQNVPKQRIGRRLRLRVPRQGEFIESRAGPLTYLRPGYRLRDRTAARRRRSASHRRPNTQTGAGDVSVSVASSAAPAFRRQNPPNRAWALTDARTQPSRPCARVISQGKLFNLLRARARGAHAAGRRRASHIQRGEFRGEDDDDVLSLGGDARRVHRLRCHPPQVRHAADDRRRVSSASMYRARRADL